MWQHVCIYVWLKCCFVGEEQKQKRTFNYADSNIGMINNCLFLDTVILYYDETPANASSK